MEATTLRLVQVERGYDEAMQHRFVVIYQAGGRTVKVRMPILMLRAEEIIRQVLQASEAILETR